MTQVTPETQGIAEIPEIPEVTKKTTTVVLSFIYDDNLK